MNTSVQALQLVYIKMGGALTDTYPTIASGEMVGNYTAIPDVVEAIAQISKPDGGGGSGDNDFVVNYITETNVESGENTIVCDKTAAEIYEAWEAGKNVRAKLPIGTCYLASCEKDSNDNLALQFGTAKIMDNQVAFLDIFHRGSPNEADQIQSFRKALIDNERLDRLIGDIESIIAEKSLLTIYYQVSVDAESGGYVVDLYSPHDDIMVAVENEIAIAARLLGNHDINETISSEFMPCIKTEVVYSDQDREAITQCTVKYSFVRMNENDVVACFLTHVMTIHPDAETGEPSGEYDDTFNYEEKILSVQAP